MYVPGFKNSLVSIRKITEEGHDIFSGDQVEVVDSRIAVAKGKEGDTDPGGPYALQNEPQIHLSANTAVNASDGQRR